LLTSVHLDFLIIAETLVEQVTTVELQFNEMPNGIRVLKLIGTLDIAGTGEIETKFSGYCAGEKPLVVVDLSEVDFLASIGIRLLIINAKSIASRAGKMTIVSPIPEVQNVLEVTGIPAIIPTYSHFESAEAVLMWSREHTSE
jgi:anti-anti-sigma factor